MLDIIYIAVIAVIARLDGWGPTAAVPRWQTLAAKAIGVWSAGALVAVITSLYTEDPFIGLIVGLGFVLWRAPELGDYWGGAWQHWHQMFLRAALTTLPTFALLAIYLYEEPYYGWLFIPMGLGQMVLYNGNHRYLDGKIANWLQQWIAELGTGTLYAFFVVIIIRNAL